MRIKLRTKLLALVLASVFISLGAAITPLIVIFQNAQRSATVDAQAQIAGAAAKEISHFLETQFFILNEARFLVSLGLWPDELSRKTFMRGFLFRNDALFDITLVDPNGNELIRENRYQVIKPSDLKNRSQNQEFQITKERGHHLGILYFEGGRPLFRLGQAISDNDGRLLVIVIAEVDASIMQEVVRRTTVAQVGGGRAFIVDKNGIVIAHPNFSEVLAQKDFSFLSIVDALKQNRSFSSRYQNEINEEVLGAWAPITVTTNGTGTATGWYIIAEEDVLYALRHVNRALRLGLVSLISIFTLAVAGAWFISRRIVRPIEAVHRAVTHFGQGKFSERVSVQTEDEIKDLAGGFNQMAEKIAVYTNTLKEERDQISAIVASLGDGLIMYSPEKKTILLNPKAQTLLWVSPEKVSEKPLRDKSAFNTSLLKNFYRVSTLPLENWETKEYTTEVPKKTVLQITRVTLTGPKGKNLGSMRVLHDITKEKEVEAMKSEFVSLASHQLRTPLSGIKWALDLLLKEEFGKLDESQRKIVEETLHASERMVDVVSDLLDVSRIEEGRFGYHFTLQSLEDLTEESVKRFAQQIQRKNLQFSFEKPQAPLPKVSIDSEKMEMALQNVIDNAIKYTNEGGKIKIYFETSTTHLTFLIEDTGIGIPRDQQLRVFEKFFRAVNAVKLQTEGSGLGLFIAKSITEAHGGKIGFVSVESSGSTFYISLPIDPRLMPKGKEK